MNEDCKENKPRREQRKGKKEASIMLLKGLDEKPGLQDLLKSQQGGSPANLEGNLFPQGRYCDREGMVPRYQQMTLFNQWNPELWF